MKATKRQSSTTEDELLRVFQWRNIINGLWVEEIRLGGRSTRGVTSQPPECPTWKISTQTQYVTSQQDR